MRFQFNARTIMPNTGGAEKWPDGNYPLIIIGAEGKAIKTGDTTGSRLVFEVQCIDGPNKGKKNFIGLNLEHANDTTKRIAWEHLSAITWVCGKPDMNQTEDLYNIPFVAYATGSERGNNWGNFKTINGENAIDVYNRVAAGGPIFPQGQAPMQAMPPNTGAPFVGGQPQGGFPQTSQGPAQGGFPQQGQPAPGGWATGPGAGQPAQGGFAPPNGPAQQGQPQQQGGGWGAGPGTAQQGGGFVPPGGPVQQQGQQWTAGGPAPTAQPGWQQ